MDITGYPATIGHNWDKMGMGNNSGYTGYMDLYDDFSSDIVGYSTTWVSENEVSIGLVAWFFF